MYMSGIRGNRSDAAIDLLSRFSIVCVNKMEHQSGGCSNSSCNEERYQIDTLRRVKQRNPHVFTMACVMTDHERQIEMTTNILRCFLSSNPRVSCPTPPPGT